MLKIREQRIKNIGKSREKDIRNPFDMDYARLIHSSAFRRLQGKSQIFSAGTGDYYRTRLTHSLEVAQIARSAAQILNDKNETKDVLEGFKNPGLIIDPKVVECAALAHDFGHPPFGHKGEQVLNAEIEKDFSNLQKFGDFYFEGNPNNFRLLMFLEKKSDYDGLDLTSAVLLAINKYPYLGNRMKKKGVYKEEWKYIDIIRNSWGLPPEKATLEAQLMDICDDIAYSTHDLEDGIKAGKINVYNLLDADLIRAIAHEIDSTKSLWNGIDVGNYVSNVLGKYKEEWDKQYKKCFSDSARTRREVKGYWVNKFITNLGIIKKDNWYKITFINSELKEDKDIKREIAVLKKLAWITMIRDVKVQRLQNRSERIIKGLWDAFKDEERGKTLLPPDWVKRWDCRIDFLEDENEWPWVKMVCDYIAGMTDTYAEEVYMELYGYGAGSIYGID